MTPKSGESGGPSPSDWGAAGLGGASGANEAVIKPGGSIRRGGAGWAGRACPGPAQDG